MPGSARTVIARPPGADADGERRSAGGAWRWLRRLWAVAGLLVLVCAGAGVLAHFFGPVSTTVTLLASFSPLCVVLVLVSFVVLSAAHCRVPAAAALVVAVVGAIAQSPLYLDNRVTVMADAPKFRLLQANIRLGEADPRALLDLARAEHIDVMTVAELTEPAADRLAAAGVYEVLPFSYLQPRRGGGGAGIYSRHPLDESVKLPGLQHNNLRATMHIPGSGPVAVFALHPVPPYPEPAWKWALELDRLGAALDREPLPLVVGADFNSTYDHRRYRDLVAAGTKDGRPLIDAAEYLGSGIVATFPADTWYPAVLAIDRILARGATPLSFRRVDLPGSDHHGVVADIGVALPGQR